MSKVLRSIYIDHELDMQLASRAKDESVSKSALIVEYIKQGLKASETKFLEKPDESEVKP